MIEGFDLRRFAPQLIVLEGLDGDLTRFDSIRRYCLSEWLSPRDVLLALGP